MGMWEYLIKVDTCIYVSVFMWHLCMRMCTGKHKTDGTWFTLGHVTRREVEGGLEWRNWQHLESLFNCPSHECLDGEGAFFLCTSWIRPISNPDQPIVVYSIICDHIYATNAGTVMQSSICILKTDRKLK